MTWKGKTLDRYTEIIDFALKLKGKEQKAFVRAYAKTGKFALTNVGYFAWVLRREKAGRDSSRFRYGASDLWAVQ